jgi:hypothetical protein
VTRVAPRHEDVVRGWSERIALRITRAVGTMTCALVFAGIALVSLPAALGTGDPIVIVAWIAQTFLQLVLLSVLMLGQNLAARAGDARAQATSDHVDAILRRLDTLGSR